MIITALLTANHKLCFFCLITHPANQYLNTLAISSAIAKYTKHVTRFYGSPLTGTLNAGTCTLCR